MNKITINPIEVAGELAEQAVIDELVKRNEGKHTYISEKDLFIKDKETKTLTYKEEPQDVFIRYYDYFFEMITNSCIEDISNVGTGSITWTVADFESKAEELFYYYKEIDKEHDKNILEDCKSWEDYYDKNKFLNALEEMIHDHDCDIGITWYTVGYYLDTMCRKIR